MKRVMTATAAWLVLAGAAAAQDDGASLAPMDQPRDWSATLAQDATSLHAIMVDSHPGTHDPLNPEFRGRLDAGLARALERADAATDAGGWWWALREYVAAFEDGHVGLSLNQQGYGFPTRWPGFLTVWSGGQNIVRERDEGDASAPPVGARLIDCDGIPADALAEQRIGAFRGRWFLESQRVQFGDWLFMNASNPWTPEMSRCRFETDGQVRDYVLNWRLIEAGELSERRTRLMQTARPEFGLRHFDDGGFWISTPSFDGDPSGQVHAVLTALIAEMKDKQDALRAAPWVVLDVRGNGGGSSQWGDEMALVLWGEDWLVAHSKQSSDAVDWRVSADNLAEIEGFVAQLREAGGSEEVMAWADRAIAGMRAAQARGDIYWRETADMDEAAPTSEPAPVPADETSPVAGHVYVLTDSVCASACLDAVDVWKPAGAIQIGRETSADTLYMDIRNPRLASGLATLAVPMKVYRGRGRGNNEPHKPEHRFDGDMTDDAALLDFVRALEAR